MPVTSTRSQRASFAYGLIGLSLLACSERDADLFAAASGASAGGPAGAGASASGASAGGFAANDAGGAAGTTVAGAAGVNAGGMTSAGASGSGGAEQAGASGAAGNAGASDAGRAGNGGISGTAGTSGGGGAGTANTAGQAGVAGAGGSSGVSLDPTPGTYRRACDGSLGVRLDADRFLAGSDEDQALRVYRRGVDASPEHVFDLSEALELSDSDEADLEDAARIGDRVYVVSSHGRTSDGELNRERFRFFAFDIEQNAQELALRVAGFTQTLLDDLLVASNWITPNSSVIAALAAAATLDEDDNEDLTPDAGGATIEGLAQASAAVAPATLWLGFRNPTLDERAIVVSLLNPDAALTGATARFGEAALLDLGGLGIRALAWSSAHNALLLVAGSHTAGGSFRIYQWSGVAADAPLAVADLTGLPSDSAPEAILPHPGSLDVQILFDQGDHAIDDEPCKDASEDDRSFGDRILHVP